MWRCTTTSRSGHSTRLPPCPHTLTDTNVVHPFSPLDVKQKVIKAKYGQDATNVGDEGGFAPNILVS